MAGRTAVAPVTAAELRERIGRVPRVPLAHAPTPLEEYPRFARALGTTARIFVKRDDLTGVALGGNKVRNLEFRLADALAQGADTLLLGVDILSNSARQTAAVANRHGLRCVLVLVGREPDGPPRGNLLIDRLLGAEVHFAPDVAAQQATLERLAGELAAAGRRPYVMTATPFFAQAAALAYADCTLELLDQLEALGLGAPDALYISSSGKGVAGPLLAVRALGLPTRLVSVSPRDTGGAALGAAAEVCAGAAGLLGLDLRGRPADHQHRDEYGPPGYGVTNPAALEAIRLLARTEGLLLDPVYTGKAVAGLIGDARRGRIGPGEIVVYVHTGGLPLIFDHDADLLPILS
ncbi:MAG TPA: pyridoxal-phosphate dependent enzyme [Thermomicrobiales bacterium]|nr:pyridoxal-phosphate dependent enzyme [Thermomicrobiales bacterium]